MYLLRAHIYPPIFSSLCCLLLLLKAEAQTECARHLFKVAEESFVILLCYAMLYYIVTYYTVLYFQVFNVSFCLLGLLVSIKVTETHPFC
jgi:hypothetical protein